MVNELTIICTPKKTYRPFMIFINTVPSWANRLSITAGCDWKSPMSSARWRGGGWDVACKLVPVTNGYVVCAR